MTISQRSQWRSMVFAQVNIHILLNQLFDTHHITGTQGITRRMILNLNR